MTDPASDTPTCLAPPLVVRTPQVRLPAGTCDTHLHVFGPPDRYPLSAGRSYTPHVSTLTQYRAVMEALGIARAVLVQPSVYGTDNTALLDALREAGPAFRGVAVPPPDMNERELQALHRTGVRGVRLNLVNPQVLNIESALALCGHTAALGWHLHVQIDLVRTGFGALMALVERAPLPPVIEHMGLADPLALAPELLELLRRNRCWVKLSAPYRVGRDGTSRASLAALANALATANPDRVLWGSDWPHTEQRREMPDTASLADQLCDWLPDVALRRQICVENPARLYGF